MNVNVPPGFSPYVETDGATDVYEAAYESAVRERKEAFILVFQRFVEVMTEKLKLSGAEDDQWWRWVSGFMRETGRNVRSPLLYLMNMRTYTRLVPKRNHGTHSNSGYDHFHGGHRPED